MGDETQCLPKQDYVMDKGKVAVIIQKKYVAAPAALKASKLSEHTGLI
jgi:hypothetical protein